MPSRIALTTRGVSLGSASEMSAANRVLEPACSSRLLLPVDTHDDCAHLSYLQTLARASLWQGLLRDGLRGRGDEQ